MALIQRDERPATEPMFSPTGVPYYQAWRAAIYSWAKDPTRRPSMEEVARMLKPISRPMEEPEAAPERAFSGELDVLTETSPAEESSLGDWDGAGEVGTGPDGDLGADPDEDDEEPYCYCGVVSDGDVIECDSSLECTLRWVGAFPFVVVLRD